MPGLLQNWITGVAMAADGRHLHLTWADGSATLFDMAPVTAQGGVFTGFCDPLVLAQVAVGPRGRSLVWPGDIDLDADALWFDAHPADNPFNQPAAAE